MLLGQAVAKFATDTIKQMEIEENASNGTTIDSGDKII